MVSLLAPWGILLATASPEDDPAWQKVLVDLSPCSYGSIGISCFLWSWGWFFIKQVVMVFTRLHKKNTFLEDLSRLGNDIFWRVFNTMFKSLWGTGGRLDLAHNSVSCLNWKLLCIFAELLSFSKIYSFFRWIVGLAYHSWSSLGNELCSCSCLPTFCGWMETCASPWAPLGVSMLLGWVLYKDSGGICHVS